MNLKINLFVKYIPFYWKHNKLFTNFYKQK